MPRRRLEMIEIGEILYRWQQGMKKKTIALSLGISRNTVRKEICLAEAAGLTGESNAAAVDEYLSKRTDQLSQRSKRGSQADVLKQHHEQILAWLAMPHMTIKQIQRLFSEREMQFPYSTLQYYIPLYTIIFH